MAPVPLLWKQSSMPFVCGLVVRAGRADETPATGGITHLIEHLALPTRWPPEVEFNASVDALFTHFWFAGPQRPAVEMLQGLTCDLAALPFARLLRERGILKAETSWRGSPGVLQQALLLRYGAAGHGQTALYEYALEGAGRPEVRAWAARVFTAGNACCYMTARPPDELALELPRGGRLPLPKVEPLPDVTLPAVWAGGPAGGAAVSMLVERSFAAVIAEQLAVRRLNGLLRYRLGITYSATSSREPISRTLSHLFLSADARPEDVDSVARALVVVLDELAERGPTEQELARERTSLRRRPVLVAALDHYLAGRWPEAVEGFERGLRRTPDEADAWGFVAFALDRTGDKRLAVAAAERASALDPVDDWAPRYAAGALDELGRLHEAAAAAGEALRRNPTSLENVCLAAGLFAADGRLAEAERLSARAVELFPDGPFAWLSRAWSLRAHGDLPAAVAEACRAMDAQPDDWRWRAALGRLLAESGAAADAVAELTAALELAPEAEPYAAPVLEVALALSGREDEAGARRSERHAARIARAREQLAARPDDEHALLEAGEALAAAPDGDAAEAAALLDRAMAAGAAQAWPLVVRARLELALGVPRAAQALLTAATRIAPEHTGVLAERARIAAVAGAAHDGEAAADALARLRPGSAAAAFAHACALVAAGKWRPAAKAADAAVTRDPLSCCAHAVGGIARAHSGRIDEAERALAAARARADGRCTTADHLEALLAGAAAGAR